MRRPAPGKGTGLPKHRSDVVQEQFEAYNFPNLHVERRHSDKLNYMQHAGAHKSSHLRGRRKLLALQVLKRTTLAAVDSLQRRSAARDKKAGRLARRAPGPGRGRKRAARGAARPGGPAARGTAASDLGPLLDGLGARLVQRAAAARCELSAKSGGKDETQGPAASPSLRSTWDGGAEESEGEKADAGEEELLYRSPRSRAGSQYAKLRLSRPATRLLTSTTQRSGGVTGPVEEIAGLML
jgi:hypothetical protein